jgi:hypothetical protein
MTLPSDRLTRTAFGLIGEEVGSTCADSRSISRRAYRSQYHSLARILVTAFRRESDWKLSLKHFLSYPDLLANIRDQLAAVTRSSPGFAVAEALPNVVDDLLPCQ